MNVLYPPPPGRMALSVCKLGGTDIHPGVPLLILHATCCAGVGKPVG
jgi:hypothetical protein